MTLQSENARVTSVLSRALETLCEGCWSAVRVACVPNGLEYRFLVRIEAPWRPDVYSYLAKHTKIWIPPDGGPLNLSMDEALRMGDLAAQYSSDEAATLQPVETTYREPQFREPRHIPADLTGEALRDTFQP
jgi:hypothetical protein